MVIAHLGDVGDVGTYALALAICNPVMIFAQLALRPLVATSGTAALRFADYFSLRVLATLFGLLVILAVSLIVGYGDATLGVVLALALAKAVDNVSDVTYGLHQRAHRLDIVGRSLIVRSVSGLLFFTGAYAVTGNLVVSALGLMIAWAVVAVAYDLPTAFSLYSQTRRSALLHWNPSAWLVLVSMGFPIGLSGLLSSLNTNIPRYFIDVVVSRNDLGVFAALAYSVTLLNVIANSIAQSSAPDLGEAASIGDGQRFLRILSRLRLVALGAGVIGLLGSLVFGRPLLALFYGPTFAAKSGLLPVFMVVGALSFASTFASYGLIALRHTRTLPAILSTTVATCLFLSLLLVPRWHLLGATIAWSCSLALQLTWSEVAVHSRIRRMSLL